MPEGPWIEDPRLRRIIGEVDQRGAALLRRLRLGRGLGVLQQAQTLSSTVGYQLATWTHRPAGATGPLPAVLLCPDGRQGAAAFAGTDGLVSADEIARLGAVVMRFDPAGRGQSWGEEDLGGPEHQDEVAGLLAHLAALPEVDPARIGLLSIGDGIAMAAGALALQPGRAAWLIDFEGPSDRETLLAGTEPAAPARPLSDEAWWNPREARRHIGRIGCGYVRLQGEEDHARPDELRHALRMLHAAEAGDLPWFQINDHPRNDAPVRPWWLSGGRMAQNQAILRKISALLTETRPG